MALRVQERGAVHLFPILIMEPARDTSSPRWPGDWRSLAVALGTFFAVLWIGDQLLGQAFKKLVAGSYGGGKLGRVNWVLTRRPQTLLVGSSRMAHHLDDGAMSKLLGRDVVNAGFDGQGVMFGEALYRLLRSRGAAPKLVICDISQNEDEASRLHALDPWYGEDAGVDQMLAGQHWQDRVALGSRTYRYANSFMPLAQAYRRPPPAFGFLAPVPLASGPRLPAVPGFRAGRVSPELVDGLVSLINLVRSHGAEIVLIEPPRYRRGASTETLSAGRASELTGVQFWQFNLQASPQFARPELYIDDGHLTAEGARQLTELVAARISESGL